MSGRNSIRPPGCAGAFLASLTRKMTRPPVSRSPSSRAFQIAVRLASSVPSAKASRPVRLAAKSGSRTMSSRPLSDLLQDVRRARRPAAAVALPSRRMIRRPPCFSTDQEGAVGKEGERPGRGHRRADLLDFEPVGGRDRHAVDRDRLSRGWSAPGEATWRPQATSVNRARADSSKPPCCGGETYLTARDGCAQKRHKLTDSVTDAGRTMDALDRRILREVQRDCSMSAAELAERCGTTESTALRRFKAPQAKWSHRRSGDARRSGQSRARYSDHRKLAARARDACELEEFRRR